jgi:hypothetical protein
MTKEHRKGKDKKILSIQNGNREVAASLHSSQDAAIKSIMIFF